VAARNNLQTSTNTNENEEP